MIPLQGTHIEGEYVMPLLDREDEEDKAI